MSYPSAIDTWANMTNQTLQAAGHLTRHNDLQTAIIGLETKIGITSSSDVTSFDYLLKSTSSSNPGHKHTLAQGATDVTATFSELNTLVGITSTAAELNALHGNMGAAKTWVPTVDTIGGTMTISGLVVDIAQYIKIGRHVSWSMKLTFTTGGTPESNVRFTLPVARASVIPYESLGNGIYSQSGGGTTGSAYVLSENTAQTTAFVSRYDTTNYIAASTTLQVSGWYASAS